MNPVTVSGARRSKAHASFQGALTDAPGLEAERAARRPRRRDRRCCGQEVIRLAQEPERDEGADPGHAAVGERDVAEDEDQQHAAADESTAGARAVLVSLNVP